MPPPSIVTQPAQWRHRVTWPTFSEEITNQRSRHAFAS